MMSTPSVIMPSGNRGSPAISISLASISVSSPVSRL